MAVRRAFLLGFLLGLSIFVAVNLLAAHLRSDCGLQAWIGRAGCADDIRRAGFPILFWEQGGFLYRNSFDRAALLVDGLLGTGLALATGFIARRRAGRNPPPHQP